ncbi:MAG: aspartate aminotransferase family protein [Deltaproteobacteria bacterium]|nr:aspartate aminotransferase family protein [Deltaproteobacteria bacterium]
MNNLHWLKRLQDLECPDATWSPEDDPLVLETAQGSLLSDVEGRSYIDLCAGFGSLPLGHNHETVREILHKHSNEIIHGLGDVYPSRFKIELMETLASLLPPSLDRMALAVTGSQAVELAMKTAILATGRSGFVSFEGAYHGLDMGSLSLTGREDFIQPFHSWFRQDRVTQLPFRCSMDLLRSTFRSMEKASAAPAAVIVEPIQGRGGVRAAGLEWLSRLRELCTQEGVLLIFDEIFTGLGRSGRITFAEEVPCDLLCLGKTLGGGFPLSACVGPAKIMSAWPVNKGEALHTGTFFGHPLSCQVANATLQMLAKEALWQRTKSLGTVFKEMLNRTLLHHPSVKEVRGEGFMLAIEFKRPGVGAVFMNQLRKAGVIAIPCGHNGECLSLTPAFNITEQLLNDAVARL